MNQSAEVTFSPDLILPFQGYRRLDMERPLHDLAPSLTHFYEAEKFRTRDDLLRQEVLSCPTPRAAVKLAKRHKDKWREDWARLRPYVLRAGLAMQMVQSAAARDLARRGYDQALELACLKRVGSLPGMFVSRVLTNLYETIHARSSMRLGSLCLQGYVPSDLEHRLTALAGVAPPLAATVYAGPESDIQVEQWCMTRGVAVRVVGAEDTRLRASEHQELTARVNTLLLCAPKSRRAVAEIVGVVAKQRSPKVRILDFTLQVRREPNTSA